ncbi:MAG: hypothetical protein QG644_135 [Patescibacteria group bacterium]|nr:hypothetical protein [Patescibacteria group bacterium]
MIQYKLMIITYFGKQFFKISQGDMVLALNPVSKSSKSGVSARFGADIALLSLNHPDYNGKDEIRHGEREPFVISGPGDYETREVFIKGIMSQGEIGGKKFINTIYSFSVDSIHVVFLGVLGEEEISKEAREEINEPDILFVPIGGKGMLDVKSAAKLASSLEPKMVIPMDYDDQSLKAFLKEMGNEKADVVDKLVLKRKDLEGKEGDVVVLSRA